MLQCLCWSWSWLLSPQSSFGSLGGGNRGAVQALLQTVRDVVSLEGRGIGEAPGSRWVTQKVAAEERTVLQCSFPSDTPNRHSLRVFLGETVCSSTNSSESVEFNCVFQPCSSRLYLVELFLRRTMSTQHWSRVVKLQANTSGKQSVERIAGGNLDTVTY